MKLTTENIYSNGAAFTISNKVITFSREHLIINEYARDIFRGSVFSTYEEAVAEMRIQFIWLIEHHYNTHEFKNNPILIK